MSNKKLICIGSGNLSFDITTQRTYPEGYSKQKHIQTISSCKKQVEHVETSCLSSVYMDGKPILSPESTSRLLPNN